MNDLKDFHGSPERMAALYEEPRGWAVPIIVVGAVLLAIGAGLYVYLQGSFVSFSPYKDVYEQFDLLGLPSSFERDRRVAQRLDQLRREPCDRDGIVALADLLVAAGYPREVTKSARRFAQRCGPDEELFEKAYAALFRLADFADAASIASDLVTSDPARGRFRFLRGRAYESQKNYNAALSDYISALQLFTDLSNVASSEFYRISRMYDVLGRPCDAITPLEMYLSYDVAKRQTAQISRLISEFATKGNCQATYAAGSDRIPVGPANLVDVVINGARGRMIVDTGASMVAITPSFASRARIVPDERNLITLNVVGGKAQQAPGNAQMVQVGKARAANVPLTVSVGNDTAFGQVDGLLGMTFLARFEMSLTNGVLELKPRVLK